MGANVWQRDTTGSGSGNTFNIGPAPIQHPARPGKRKLVWTKEQQDQPTTPAAFTPGPASHRTSDAPSISCSQHDHFEKRARLNDGLPASRNGHYRGDNDHQPHRPPVTRPCLAETKQQQTGAGAKDPAAVQAQRLKAAELAELKWRIQKHEAQLAAQKVFYIMTCLHESDPANTASAKPFAVELQHCVCTVHLVQASATSRLWIACTYV